MSFFGLIFLIIVLYTLYIIGRVLYTGYSFMRAMGIKPKFTRKGPQFESDFRQQHQQQQKPHDAGTSGNAHHESGSTRKQESRSGKIFSKNEGEYIDFEEIK